MSSRSAHNHVDPLLRYDWYSPSLDHRYPRVDFNELPADVRARILAPLDAADPCYSLQTESGALPTYWRLVGRFQLEPGTSCRGSRTRHYLHRVGAEEPEVIIACSLGTPVFASHLMVRLFNELSAQRMAALIDENYARRAHPELV
jgi:hypothetical protein